MKKKIIALSVALVLVVAAAVSATLAYFTDEDNLSNKYVIGNIEIDAWEDAVHTDMNDNVINEAKAEINKVGGENETETGFLYDNIFPGDTMEKIVTVDNTGANGAYVAIAVTRTEYRQFNEYIDNYYEAMDGYGKDSAELEALYDDIFVGKGWMDIRYTKTDSTIEDQDGNLLRGYPAAAIDAVKNQAGDYDYFNLKPTEATLIAVDFAKCSGPRAGALRDISTVYGSNMLDQKYYDWVGDNCITVYYYYIPAGKSVELDLTIDVPASIDENSINAFSNMEVNVRATAIQAQGFASAEEAFVALADVYPYFTVQPSTLPVA
ncbi:MAG: hypothetical protein IJN86_06925 [Clostridia bacterium]|nr:hypothetical protein [Clostridia bacterium]